jgi:glucan biosynthesis protein C
VVFSHAGLQASIQRLRWLSLTLTLLSLGLFLYLSFHYDLLTFGTPRYTLVLGLRGLGSWCFILAILGFGRQHLDFSTPFLKYANQAVLPFYILHQTVLLCVGYFVVQWAIPDLLKWVIILPVSFAIIMGLYELLVRRYNLMRFLFGMKPLVKQPTPQVGEALLAKQ